MRGGARQGGVVVWKWCGGGGPTEDSEAVPKVAESQTVGRVVFAFAVLGRVHGPVKAEGSDRGRPDSLAVRRGRPPRAISA